MKKEEEQKVKRRPKIKKGGNQTIHKDGPEEEREKKKQSKIQTAKSETKITTKKRRENKRISNKQKETR